jgi:hypothetical protein
MEEHYDPNDDESYAAMCERTESSFAAMVARATRISILPNYRAGQAGANEAEAKPRVQQQQQGRSGKEETPTESWKRVSQKREAKSVKSVKTAAKKLVKQKKINTITSHFNRK